MSPTAPPVPEPEPTPTDPEREASKTFVKEAVRETLDELIAEREATPSKGGGEFSLSNLLFGR